MCLRFKIFTCRIILTGGILCAMLLHASVVYANRDSTVLRSFWIAYKYGSSYNDFSEFRNWAVSQGLGSVSATNRNRVVGFDMLYHKSRLVLGLSSDFELRSSGETAPYFFSLCFRSGYRLLKWNRIYIDALGGVGVGYTFVRFEGNLPVSIRDVAGNYSDPYARAASLIGRVELMASRYLTRTGKLAVFKPVLLVNMGMQPVLHHGAWFYGDSELSSMDGSNFIGQRIDMPRFHRSNWFINVGLALSIGNRSS